MFCTILGHLFVLAADEMPSALTLLDAQYQHQAMYRSITSNLNKSTDHIRTFERYFFQDVQNRSNECAWRGVQCDDTIITSFVFVSRSIADNRIHFELDLNWLPSSLEAIHLWNIAPASPWTPERLPRKLRYFYFWGLDNLNKVSQNCNLRNLPNAIEEIHLINSWPNGSVLLADLPASVRFFSILHWDLRRVYVDNASLSDKLEVMNIYVEARTKCIPIGEAEWDNRVKRLTDGKEFLKFFDSSEMYEKYSAIADQHLLESQNL